MTAAKPVFDNYEIHGCRRIDVVVGLVLVNDAFLNVAGWFYQFVPQPNL